MNLLHKKIKVMVIIIAKSVIFLHLQKMTRSLSAKFFVYLICISWRTVILYILWQCGKIGIIFWGFAPSIRFYTCSILQESLKVLREISVRLGMRETGTLPYSQFIGLSDTKVNHTSAARKVWTFEIRVLKILAVCFFQQKGLKAFSKPFHPTYS